MKYSLIILSILFHICSDAQCNIDSSCVLYYRHKAHQHIFEVYKVDPKGAYQLIDTLELKNKNNRTFFITGQDTVYTILAKHDSRVAPPSMLQDSLKNNDFKTPENGYVDVTFMCVVDKNGNVRSNAIIYPGSSFVYLDVELLSYLKDLPLYWKPATIKEKNVQSIIIGNYNFVTGTLKWQ